MRNFFYELKQSLFQPTTLIALLLILFTPLIGLFLYQPATSLRNDSYLVTMTSFYIANPTLSAGLFSSLLISIVFLWQSTSTQRNGIQMLIAPYKKATTFHFTQLAIYLFISLSITILTSLIYYIPASNICGDVFSSSTYFLCYFLCMGCTMMIALVFSSSFYAFSQRFDLSLIALLLFCLASFTIFSNDYITRWLNPSIWALSDDFSNHRILLSVAYNRYFWFILALAICLISYCCIRIYEKNLVQSLKFHLHKWWLALLSGILLLSSYQIKANEPFLDNSSPSVDYDSYYNVPFHENIYLNKTTINLYPNLNLGSFQGEANFSITNYETESQMIRFKINPGYQINNVSINGNSTYYQVLEDDELNSRTLLVELPPTQNIECHIEYGGFPQEWEIMNLEQGSLEISDSYMCLENEVLAPNSFDLNLGDGLFELNIELPKHLMLIYFGNEDAKIIEDKTTTNQWQLKTFGTNAIIYIGDYQKEEIKIDDLTIDFYYAKKHEKILNEIQAFDLIKTVYQFCNDHFGEFSMTLDHHLKLIQRRVSGGGYAVYGASLIDELDFAKTNLEDKNKGSEVGEVMIHELVHQWWGLNRMFDEPDENGWSAEGLTVYTTYRIAKELYGEKYAYENYVKEWKKATDEVENNYYLRHPEMLERLPQYLQETIQSELLFTAQYKTIPLKILKAEQLVGGEEKMDKILKQLSLEIDPNDPYLYYEDFLEACNLTEEDLQLD